MPDIPSQGQFTDPLLERFFLSPTEKLNKEKGKQIVKAFYTQQTNNATDLNFFRGRNARWIMLMLWAKGSQAMQEFLDYINVSTALGNKAYVNIDYTQSRIAAQFVGTLVESMAKNKTYPCVNAVDDGSIKEKQDRLEDAIYRMKEVETIDELQQQSGMVLEDPMAYVPDDELAAKVYFELEDRLPKEIRFEKMLACLLEDIYFERVTNRKTIYDLCVLNAAFTKIERVAPKKYTVRKCAPTNMIYNFFMNDTGEYEITQIGEFYNMKVKDFREKLGRSESNPTGLKEEEIFELARTSTTKNNGIFNYTWENIWGMATFNQNRPYDDLSILVLDCEVDCGEDVYYVEKTDSYGKKTLTQKKSIPYQQKIDGKIVEQPKPDNVEIIKRRKNSWMRGIYAPYGDKMLYWGRPDIIIQPYTNSYKCLSSYTINIPNNDGEYVPSLFERIMEPLREYQIAKLKRKQLISKLRPTGIRIDVESARNLDLGNGDTIQWEEVVRVYDQTGNVLWSSKGIDPLQREAPPIDTAVNNTDIQTIIGLTQTMEGIVNEIRQLVGVPMYRDGSDVGDRTAAKLAEGQNQSSFNVTDFIQNANNQLWEETLHKIVLLNWNDVVREEPESKEDMLNTRFKTTVKMKITEYERQLIENDIQRYSQMPDAAGNPSLSLKDAMFIREIDNYKLARWYLSTTFEQNRRKAMEDSLKLQQLNGEEQRKSLQEKAQYDKELQDAKLAAEKEMKDWESRQQKEQILLKGVMELLKLAMTPSSGGAEGAAPTPPPKIPDIIMPVVQMTLQNVAIPMLQENTGMQQEIAINQLQQQMQQMAQRQPEMQEQQMQGAQT